MDVQFAPSNIDSNGLASVVCTLDKDEYIKELKLVANSSSDHQQIKALRWKTSKGKFCVVPSKYHPTHDVFNTGIAVDVGSGIPYGVAISERHSESMITALGLIFYDNIAEMQNDIRWNVDSANKNLKITPQVIATVNCDSSPEISSGTCRISFKYTKSNVQTIQSMPCFLIEIVLPYAPYICGDCLIDS